MSESIHLHDQELFDLLVTYLGRLTPQQMETANNALIADILNDEPVSIPSTEIPECIPPFFYSYLHLKGCQERLKMAGTVIKLYPWRGKIKYSDHFSIAINDLLHEIYIFEERLKNYFDKSTILQRYFGVEHYNKTQQGMIIRAYHRYQQNFLRARGIHVHDRDYEPRDLGALKIVELLESSPDMALFKSYKPEIVRRLRSSWLEHQRQAEDVSTQIARLAITQTRPVWLMLKPTNAG